MREDTMAKWADIPYGPVIIVKGPYAGRVGYYDDDGPRHRLLVYLYDGTPLESTLDYLTGPYPAEVSPKDVRVPNRDEAVAILVLMQTSHDLAELAAGAARVTAEEEAEQTQRPRFRRGRTGKKPPVLEVIDGGTD